MVNYKNKNFIAAALIAIPLMGYAFLGDAGGLFFAKVASAGYGAEKVTVCRTTSSELMPYVKVEVPAHVAERFINNGGAYADESGQCPGDSQEDLRQNILARIFERLRSIFA